MGGNRGLRAEIRRPDGEVGSIDLLIVAAVGAEERRCFRTERPLPQEEVVAVDDLIGVIVAGRARDALPARRTAERGAGAPVG